MKVSSLFRSLSYYLSFSSIIFACPTPNYTDIDDVVTKDSRFVLVTHPNSNFEIGLKNIKNGSKKVPTAKAGIDKVVEGAKANGIKVVYLDVGDLPQLNYPDDCNPHYWVQSLGGELDINDLNRKSPYNFSSTEIIHTGGQLTQCMDMSRRSIYTHWSNESYKGKSFKISFVMSGIYDQYFDLDGDGYGDLNMSDFLKFSHPDPATALINFLNLEEPKYKILGRDNYTWYFKNYNIFVSLNGKKLLSIQNSGAESPSLNLNFVDDYHF